MIDELKYVVIQYCYPTVLQLFGCVEPSETSASFASVVHDTATAVNGRRTTSAGTREDLGRFQERISHRFRCWHAGQVQGDNWGVTEVGRRRRIWRVWLTTQGQGKTTVLVTSIGK